ncbi:MAG: hypothetical protein MSO56_05030, partial [Clostridiales bacterium]|nr:hypothetical protein [Clostridiales bacterium]
HLKKRAFSVRRGEKRRNTGFVFRAFSTKHDGKRSFFRLPDPYLACPKGRTVSSPEEKNAVCFSSASRS